MDELMCGYDQNESSEAFLFRLAGIHKITGWREAWGLKERESPSEFTGRGCSAKFSFQSEGPGYVSKLYILQGDPLTDEGPMALRRDRNGSLISP